MTIRSDHKTAIIGRLQTLTVSGTTLQAYDHIKTSNDQYPYACITSAELLPNIGDESSVDTMTYRRGYQYTIAVIHTLEDEKTQQALETEIDNWEEAMLDLLQSRATRDYNASYLDLTVTQVSSPVNGTDINIQEGQVAKLYTIQVETLKSF